MKAKALAHILLFFANLIYAINYTVAKDVMPDYIKPSGFILLRIIGALILFGSTYLIFVNEKIEKEDFFRLIFCGLFGVTINQLLFFEGLNLSTPINAAIIMTLTPVLVVLISIFFFRKKPIWKINIGILIGIAGASNLILGSNSVNLDNNYLIGNAFILINASSYALYLILVKPLMNKYHPATIMFFVFLFGFLFAFPFGYSELVEVRFEDLPKVIIYEVLFVVICTTFIAYLFNANALKHLTAATVSIYIYLQPVLTTVIAIMFNSDSMNLDKVISTLMIFVSVYLVSAHPMCDLKEKLS